MANNRFDFLRLLFAACVAVYHLIALADLDPGRVWETRAATLAELSIQGFFIISGALVFGSWQRSRDILEYGEKRLRRLYPGYAVAILVPATVSAALTSDFAEIAGYIGANLAFANFLVPTLPGLFEGQRFEAVNGALWTLKIEVMFYLSLVLLGPICARLAGRRGGLLIFFCAIYVASELWRIGFENLAALEGHIFYAQLARQLPGQMAFFVCGIGLWVWKHKVQRHLPWIGGAGAVLCLASVFWPWAEFFRPLGLAGLVAWMAWTRGPRLPVTRFGDLSYGIYIVHFPIIQALIGLSLFEAHPAIGVVAAIGLTLAASLALWVFVERPALAPSSLYRQTRGD